MATPPGRERRRVLAGRDRPAPLGSIWTELPVLIIVAILLAVLLKTFLVQAFFIPSGSMENTLRLYDRVVVNKVVYRVRDIKRATSWSSTGWTPGRPR